METKTKILTEIINSDKTYLEYLRKLDSMYLDHKHLTLSMRPGVSRSILQNSTWAAMYKKIVRVLGWEFNHARAHCKLYFGLPILKRDVAGFSIYFDAIVNAIHAKVSDKQTMEEVCLKIMMPNPLFPSDGFPITREFKTKQGVEYTEAIVMGMDSVNFSEILD